MPRALESALDDLLKAATTEPICGSQQFAEKRLAFLGLIQCTAVSPAVAAALRAAEASLAEMVRDGRAWDSDRRALAAVRDCLPT